MAPRAGVRPWIRNTHGSRSSFNRTKGQGMKRNSVLGLVIGTIVASGVTVAAGVHAYGYCTPNGCYVWENLPSPGGGSGGGWGGGMGHSDTSPDNDYRIICTDLQANPPPGVCDASNPPPLIQNGCGSSSFDVPDFLVSTSHPIEAAGYGGIFTAACNKHDVCYGTAWESKEGCDTRLKDDMIAGAKALIPPDRWPVFQAEVEGQAAAYSSGLQWGPVGAFISGPVFDAAKTEATCRSWAQGIQQNCL